MKDLIERLEKAEGPDRRLDFDIWSAVTSPTGFAATSEPEEVRTGWFEFWKDHNGFPLYTSSIDAALTLVPQAGVWSIELNGMYHAAAWANAGTRPTPDEECLGCHPTQPAIAICVAALKARQHSPAESEQVGK